MATVAQIAANRLNAQKSTGPRSVDGKLASSMNALKHGIDAASVLIPGEDPALYERIAADYRSQIDPEGVLEEYQVETLIDSDWQRRRLKRVHAGLYRQLLRRFCQQMAPRERAHKSPLAKIRRLRRERARLEAEEIQLRLDAPLPAPEGAFAAACEKFRERNEPNSPSQPTSQPPAGQAPAAPPPPARPLAG